ncbi:MAG: hypothetical protein Q7W05_13875, partial [Deltaproteobacteria bacterium]|nr:hypothetical protein [Deltaproteobacteria bacterium]
ADWNEHNFDETSGAYVSSGEETCVYINRDNRHIERMRVVERDEAERTVKESIFKLGLGIFALSLHSKVTEKEKEVGYDGPDAEDFVRLATCALAAHIITVIRHLGAGIKK